MGRAARGGSGLQPGATHPLTKRSSRPSLGPGAGRQCPQSGVQPVSTEILTELRATLEWIDQAPLDDMSTAFYVHAFNELEANVRALLEPLDSPEPKDHDAPGPQPP